MQVGLDLPASGPRARAAWHGLCRETQAARGGSSKLPPGLSHVFLGLLLDGHALCCDTTGELRRMLSPARSSGPVTRCETGPAALNSAVNLSRRYFFVVHFDLSGAAPATHHERGGRARLPAAAGHAGKQASQPIPAQGWAVVAQQRGHRPSQGAGPVELGEPVWKPDSEQTCQSQRKLPFLVSSSFTPI
ncbi:hypothetical protein HJG60_010850 [Phyllostomus discolor]|uniref:Uncharacterized protein n=1 Tax=Phyllostomus discolor TaxID=89673 RepID=A0A834AC16_9CHIR|nr:hypothetical protein HJG60_010850 [Phyllostomus discolor]